MPPSMPLTTALRRARKEFEFQGGSAASLSSWLRSESLRRATVSLRDSAQAANRLKPLFNEVGQNIPRATINRIQQRAFEVALASGDVRELKILAKLVFDFARLDVKNEELSLAREKFEHLTEQMRRAKEKLEKVASKGGLSPEALRRIEEAAKLL